ncbi:IbrB-like domain-containing protein [Streptomyces sp. NPDC053474]|uniref:IbrB-like domain-containing protein n=1 Tax=Streptomyces sp. NPDC053474 TaxID=3365704 RepID=UPI0037D460E9
MTSHEQTALDLPIASTARAKPPRRTGRPTTSGRGADIVEAARPLFAALADLPLDEHVAALNELRTLLHEQSPFRDEPVDLVLWEKAKDVKGNAYNPNSVAPRQMELLEHSITTDGFTQPIVAWRPPPSDDTTVNSAPIEVVDGFHRHLIGKNAPEVASRLHGYLPITVINTDREALEDRQAATIRHNVARGRHIIKGLSAMVLQLKRAGKSYDWFEKHLGMQKDEVNRLATVDGLAAQFADQEFSEAWKVKPEAWAADHDTFTGDTTNI